MQINQEIPWPRLAVEGLAIVVSILLCSDGAYAELPAFQLAELMGEPDFARACDGIIDAMLEGRAPDNASAIVVAASND